MVKGDGEESASSESYVIPASIDIYFSNTKIFKFKVGKYFYSKDMINTTLLPKDILEYFVKPGFVAVFLSSSKY